MKKTFLLLAIPILCLAMSASAAEANVKYMEDLPPGLPVITDAATAVLPAITLAPAAFQTATVEQGSAAIATDWSEPAATVSAIKGEEEVFRLCIAIGTNLGYSLHTLSSYNDSAILNDNTYDFKRFSEPVKDTRFNRRC